MRQVRILIWLNVCIWLIYAGFWIAGDAAGMVSALALTSGWQAFLHHPWTILTYMLFHISPIHLLVNMLFLYFFGVVAADCGASRVVVPLYLAGGIFGGVLYMLFGSGYMVGASAALLAVVVGVGFSYSTHRIVIKGRNLPHAGVIAAIIALITLPFITDLSTWMAHAAGALVGLIYLLLLFGAKRSGKYVIDKENNPVASATEADRRAAIEEKVRISGYRSLTAEERAFLSGEKSEKTVRHL
jgi:membrane associated rhomboid family serine protease